MRGLLLLSWLHALAATISYFPAGYPFHAASPPAETSSCEGTTHCFSHYHFATLPVDTTGTNACHSLLFMTSLLPGTYFWLIHSLSFKAVYHLSTSHFSSQEGLYLILEAAPPFIGTLKGSSSSFCHTVLLLNMENTIPCAAFTCACAADISPYHFISVTIC